MISERQLLVAISFISFLLVGVGIVLPAWVAFQIGGSRLVGFVLLAASVASLALAPVTGHIIDRCDRRQMAILGQAIRGGGLLLISPAQLVAAPFGQGLLIAASALGALGFSLHNGAFSGLIQALVPPGERVAYVISMDSQASPGVSHGRRQTAIF